MRFIAPILLCAVAALGAGQPKSGSDFFPFAVWYGGGKARAPMLERDPKSKQEIWRKDLKAIKSLGFNSIRCWIDWASGEPAEGRYDFETIETLLKLAEQEELKVITQIYMDAAPDWVGRKYPDSLYVSISGAVMRPESAPGYCRDHPGVARAEQAFLTALAERAAKSRAFLGWDLWSEPHVINWADATYLTNAEFCFCPHSVARYRKWLQHKYGDLDGLNAAWYRRFSSWDEVEPNRLSTILSYTDYIDWRSFIQDKLAEDLKSRYEAVKRGAPDRVATSHAAAPNLFTSPLEGDGNPNDWAMKRIVDYYGTSFYPKHSYAAGRDPEWRGGLLDFAKSTGYLHDGPGWWIGELQAGFGTVALNVSGTVTPEDLRLWEWSAIARGAKAINVYAWYPMSTGYESGGFGLINLDGTLTDRSRAAGEVARIVTRHSDIFAQARPARAEVAIVHNPLSYFVGGRQRAATTYGPQSEAGAIERDSMLGVYRALFSSNVPVDFIPIDDLADIGRYKLVYLPYPLMLPESAAHAFTDYVHQGGALVAEARAGWNNERGRAAEIIPGMGLHETLGCRETAVQSIAGGWTELVTANGDRINGRLYEETLEPLNAGATAILRFADGRVAAVESKHGKGKTVTLGSYIAAAYAAKPTEAGRKFLQGLLDWAGVKPELSMTGNAEFRWLELGRDRILFVFNHGSSDTQVHVNLPGAWSMTDLTSDSPATSSHGLKAGSVWVARATPK
jgi:beta-galactosidase